MRFFLLSFSFNLYTYNLRSSCINWLMFCVLTQQVQGHAYQNRDEFMEHVRMMHRNSVLYNGMLKCRKIFFLDLLWGVPLSLWDSGSIPDKIRWICDPFPYNTCKNSNPLKAEFLTSRTFRRKRKLAYQCDWRFCVSKFLCSSLWVKPVYIRLL